MKSSRISFTLTVVLLAFSLQAGTDISPYYRDTTLDLTKCPKEIKSIVTDNDIETFLKTFNPTITDFKIDSEFIRVEGMSMVTLGEKCGKNLKVISLGNKVFQQLNPLFTNAKGLKVALGIAGRYVIDSLLKTISTSNTEIETLEFTGPCLFTFKGLQFIFGLPGQEDYSCKNLRYFSADFCQKMKTRKEGEGFSSVKNLHFFKMTDPQTNITDADIISIAKQSPNLETLILNNCKRIHDCSIQAVAASCPNLKRLELIGHSELTDESLLALAQGCRSLEVFKISDNQNMGINNSSINGFYEFFRTQQHLQEIEIRNCPYFNDTCLAYLTTTACRIGNLETVIFDTLDITQTAFYELLVEAQSGKQVQSNMFCTWIISRCFSSEESYFVCLKQFASIYWTLIVNDRKIEIPRQIIEDYTQPSLVTVTTEQQPHQEADDDVVVIDSNSPGEQKSVDGEKKKE